MGGCNHDDLDFRASVIHADSHGLGQRNALGEIAESSMWPGKRCSEGAFAIRYAFDRGITDTHDLDSNEVDGCWLALYSSH